MIGDTPKSQSRQDTVVSLENDNEQITVQKLTATLRQNNEQILPAVRSSFKNKIDNAISEIMAGLKQSFENISEEQLQFKEDLLKLNNKIT